MSDYQAALDHIKAEAADAALRLDGAVLAAIFAIEGRPVAWSEIQSRATKEGLPNGGHLFYWDDVPAVRVACEQPDFSLDVEAEAFSGAYILHGPKWRVERLLPAKNGGVE